MSNLPTRVGGEVLAPLSTKDADRLEKKAVTLYRHLENDSMQFAVYLRQLQDAQAHLMRGFSNFGTYCETTFEGLSAVSAQNLSRQGNTLMLLEQHGRIDLAKKDNLPGTRGVRALTSILKRLGEDQMLAIYDQAMASDRKVTDETVRAATALLVRTEPLELDAPEDMTVDPEDEDEDEDDEDELPSKQRELIDHIRDLSYDLPASAGELAEALSQLKAEIDGKDTSTDQKWIDSKR